VACLPPPRSDLGYATPAALVFALALALVASVTVVRGAAIVRLSRADLTRTQLEYVLDGAQLDAAATVIRSGAGGPYHWSMASDTGWLDALAERESDKLDLAMPPRRRIACSQHSRSATSKLCEAGC